MSSKWILWLLAALFVLMMVTGYWWLTGSDEQPTTTITVNNEEKEKVIENGDIEPKEEEVTITSKLPKVKDIKLLDTPPVKNRQQADEVISQQAKKLGLSEESRLEIVSESTDEFGNAYYHLEQKHEGLPVYGAKANLEVTKGRAELLSGVWIPAIDLDTTPGYSAKAALRKALDSEGVPADRKLNIEGNPRLVVYRGSERAHLCWYIQANLTNPLSLPEYFLVEAHNPNIVMRQPSLKQ